MQTRMGRHADRRGHLCSKQPPVHCPGTDLWAASSPEQPITCAPLVWSAACAGRDAGLPWAAPRGAGGASGGLRAAQPRPVPARQRRLPGGAPGGAVPFGGGCRQCRRAADVSPRACPSTAAEPPPTAAAACPPPSPRRRPTSSCLPRATTAPTSRTGHTICSRGCRGSRAATCLRCVQCSWAS